MTSQVNTQSALEFDVIVGATADGWIGDPHGNLPFKQSADLAHFKTLTEGHVVVMGRKTLDSIGALLPNRLNVIMTKNTKEVETWLENYRNLSDQDEPKALIVSSFDNLLLRLPSYRAEHQKLFIIGGESIYSQAFSAVNVQRIWLTTMFTSLPDATTEKGWARFDIPNDYVEMVDRGIMPADSTNQFPYSFRAYVKR
ncbi:dihydrofolate reductase [Pseudoalteromonas umbrosa]|uniref:dihydrofolate reductase n=1 Tax=Pseudoalteromonas umbrosa TaxID=3048489 RepID=UPI0024C43C7E|nr:dihydrofolate reductase [Pseudoalteromonas sp. B95]MDK1290143.1 dihydrofolate reductase [Pseudoalteromonas sp. B95]